MPPRIPSTTPVIVRLRKIEAQLQKASDILNNPDKTGALNFHEVDVADKLANVDDLIKTVERLRKEYDKTKSFGAGQLKRLERYEIETVTVLEELAPVNSDNEEMEFEEEKAPVSPPKAKPRTQIAAAHSSDEGSHATAIARSGPKSPGAATVTSGPGGHTIHVNIVNAATASAEASAPRRSSPPPAYKEKAEPNLKLLDPIERVRYLKEQAQIAEQKRQEEARQLRMAKMVAYGGDASDKLSRALQQVDEWQEGRKVLLSGAYDRCVGWLIKKAEERSEIETNFGLDDRQKTLLLKACPVFLRLDYAWMYYSQLSPHQLEVKIMSQEVEKLNEKLASRAVKPEVYGIREYLLDHPELKDMKDVLFTQVDSEDYFVQNPKALDGIDFGAANRYQVGK